MLLQAALHLLLLLALLRLQMFDLLLKRDNPPLQPRRL